MNNEQNLPTSPYISDLALVSFEIKKKKKAYACIWRLFAALHWCEKQCHEWFNWSWSRPSSSCGSRMLPVVWWSLICGRGTAFSEVVDTDTIQQLLIAL